ncbi:prolyl oligopeptidase family serine peptidase [Roseateles saccharophilus]|uniref:Dipeptidyl aminopeptidase/acylaminoacyl peptidase n=1 Tax=Roseateles saccharophilus TaxID=304 RepID=A0A4R3UNM1_ROSSA|nr:prolyl oligopeptidase family serine peptidase [Roseateles saccharophilus]MDG0833572.1 S9 family peptidase [Roseateles saccharophilus]TCU92180.1 dipeptidyl aminopeptidase/acylaminoacyl peptidase [Roseateles saccharophilus]
MKTLKCWAGALAGLVLGVGAAQAAPPPAEVFYRDADIAEAVLSPSGKRLAITSAKGAQRAGLVVFDLNPGGQLKRVAQFADGDVWRVQWVDEDRLVFGVVDSSEGSGRSTAPGLFAVNADGSKLRQLVRRMYKPFINNGDTDDERLLDWNHWLLSVPTPRAAAANGEVLVAHVALDDEHVQTPMWLNTRTGRSRDAYFDPPAHTVHWLVDAHGEPRVAFTQYKGRQAAYWHAPGATGWSQLYDSDLLAVPFGIVATDDAGGLYVTRTEGPQRYAVLSRYDFEHHAPETKPLVTAPGFDFDGQLITDDAGRLLGVRLRVDGQTTVWFDDAMKALQQRADRLFPGRINQIDCRRCAAPDMVALVRSYSDRDPGRLYLFQASPAEGEKNWRAIGPVREGVKPEQMASLDLQRIKARDGSDLPVWVTKSPAAKGPLPAVVLVHGGPWVRGSEWSWHADAQFLASRGYVVIEPEMRGSTGYGDAHFRAGFRQFGQAMQDDVADALRWARAQGIASDKACIAGASYGGYSTLMGLIKDPDLYRCGVAWVALADLDLYLSGSWWVTDDISKTGRQYGLPELVGDPEKDATMIAANSPVKQAAHIKAPLLLAFGEDDRRVPLAHGERLRKALREAGNEPLWVTYPGEGHGFALLKNRVDFAQRMEAFLAKYLQPAQP